MCSFNKWMTDGAFIGDGLQHYVHSSRSSCNVSSRWWLVWSILLVIWGWDIPVEISVVGICWLITYGLKIFWAETGLVESVNWSQTCDGEVWGAAGPLGWVHHSLISSTPPPSLTRAVRCGGNPAGEEMKLWWGCWWGGGSQSRRQRRRLEERQLSHPPPTGPLATVSRISEVSETPRNCQIPGGDALKPKIFFQS